MHKTALLVLLIVLAVLGTGCRGGGRSLPVDPAEVRRQVTNATEQIALGITSENIQQASDYIHPNFVLHPDVAARFNVGPFTGRGPHAFRGFFERVADNYGDLNMFVTINRIEVNDNVATAFVTIHFSGLRLDPAPPNQVSFTANDVLVFEFDRNYFRLRTWGTSEHNQGGGGSF